MTIRGLRWAFLYAFLLVIAFWTLANATGPLYQHQDPATQREFQNVYQEMNTPAFTDWTSYTPSTPTNLTIGNGSITGFYRVTGKSLRMRIHFGAGSGSSVGGIVRFEPCIPSGYTINWTLMGGTNATGGTDVWDIGTGVYYDSSASPPDYVGFVRKDSSNGGSIYLAFDKADAAGEVLTTGAPVTMAVNDVVSLDFEVPVN